MTLPDRHLHAHLQTDRNLESFPPASSVFLADPPSQAVLQCVYVQLSTSWPKKSSAICGRCVLSKGEKRRGGGNCSSRGQGGGHVFPLGDRIIMAIFGRRPRSRKRPLVPGALASPPLSLFLSLTRSDSPFYRECCVLLPLLLLRATVKQEYRASKKLTSMEKTSGRP